MRSFDSIGYIVLPQEAINETEYLASLDHAEVGARSDRQGFDRQHQRAPNYLV